MSDVPLPPTRRRQTRSTSVDYKIRRTESCPRPSSSQSPSSFVQQFAVDTPGAGGSRIAASRIVSTMRRSFTTNKKRDPSPLDSGMYSTPEESRPPVYSQYSARDSPLPTIQQIAMGLHVSRTPHLRSPPHTPPSRLGGRADQRPLSSMKRIHSSPRSSPSPIVLPPPPARSSLKKPGAPTGSPGGTSLTPTTSDLSLTGSTLTMSAPPTPSARSRAASMSLFPTRLGLSVSRILRVPGRREPVAATPPLGADDDSTSTMSSEVSRRKMVRFSSSPEVPRSEVLPS